MAQVTDRQDYRAEAGKHYFHPLLVLLGTTDH